MTMFRYYAELRSELLEIVTGVENSGDSLFWDNTTSNWQTKQRLENLYIKSLADSKLFGLLVVTRHSDCENLKHQNYPVSNTYGLQIEYHGSGYIWNGGQFHQGMRRCTCPCSKKNKETEHWVIDDIIYEEKADIKSCERLEAILSDLYASINCAGEKKPRSGIREYLLRAVLRINDELLPEPIDAYLAKRLAEST